MDRGTWVAAGLCRSAVASLALAHRFGPLWVALAALPPLLLTLDARRWEAAWVACTGALAVAVAGSILPLAWMIANVSLLAGDGGLSAVQPDSARLWITQMTFPVAAGIAAVGLLVWRGAVRRVAYPLWFVLVGAIFAIGPSGLSFVGVEPWPMGFLALCELGLALLAGGLVVWLRAGAGTFRTVASAFVALLLIAAAWQNGLRPIGMTPWPLDTQALAGEPGTPVLVLPYSSATFEQAGHRRPLVNGRGAPGFQAEIVPVTTALHLRFPALDALVRLGGAGPRPGARRSSCSPSNR